MKLEKAQKGKGKDNPKSNGVAKPSAAANPGITEVLDRCGREGRIGWSNGPEPPSSLPPVHKAPPPPQGLPPKS